MRRASVNCTIVGPQNQCSCGCFAGAWEWEHLQEALEEKLKSTLAVAQLMERIRSLIGRDRVKSLIFIIASFLSLIHTNFKTNHIITPNVFQAGISYCIYAMTVLLNKRG